jgi:hypothetical protein
MVDFSNPQTLGLAQTSAPIGGGRVLGGFLPDLQVQPLVNLQAMAPLGKEIPSLGKAFSNRNAGPQTALTAAIMRMGDEFRQMNAQAGVMYAGNITNGTPVSAGYTPGGGGGYELA